MSSAEQQNGRLPAEQTQPTASSRDPRLRGVKSAPPPPADIQRLCRDFVWGICTTEDCRYRHELEFESMKQILKFCNDYQNRTGCTRADCTYLHCSREEKTQFLNNGVIPRVLAERYAAMSAPLDRREVAPHNMLYMTDYTAPPPPPPPPVNVAAPSSNSVLHTLPGPTTAMHAMPGSSSAVYAVPGGSSTMHGVAGPSSAMHSVPGLSSGMHSVPGPSSTIHTAPGHNSSSLPLGIKVTMPVMMPPAGPSLLAPPPPPPPTVAAMPPPIPGPVYTVSPAMQHTVTTMYQMSAGPSMLPAQQLSPSYSLPANYDPSVPPPPLPVAIQTIGQKRPAMHEPEAGPSKLPKHDDYAEALCDSCIDMSFRAELNAQEADKLQREEEISRLEYDARVEDYERGRALLRTKLSSQFYRAADEFIDSNAPVPAAFGDLLASTSSPTYPNPPKSVSKQLIFQLMELMEVLISKIHEEQESSTIESLARRTFPSSEYSRLSRAPDLQEFEALLDRLTAVSERREPEPLRRSAELPSPPMRYSAPAPPAPPAPYQPAPPASYPPTSPAPYQPPPAPYQPPAGYQPAPPAPAPYQPDYSPASYRAPPPPQPQPPPPPPRAAYYPPASSYSAAATGVQYGAAAPAQPSTSSGAPYQYLSRMPPGHHPAYYRPYQ